MNAGRTTQKIMLTAACLLLVSSTLLGQEEREYIRKGNRLYKKSEFAGSEGMYRRAQEQEKPYEDTEFNLGDALYKQGRYAEAASEFSKATAASEGDSLKQSEGFYNLGNSLLKEQKLKESIEAYINSLKLNPDNVQAKYNLAWAQDQLKKQEEQQKQQQDQDKNQDQKEENKEDQEKKDEQQEKDDQEKQDDQQNQEDNKDQQQQQQQQPAISREDAKRLLDALAANEKDTQEKVQRDKAAKAKVGVIKNW